MTGGPSTTFTSATSASAIRAPCGVTMGKSATAREIPHALWVTQIDRIALQPFDGLRDVHAADGGAHDVLYIVDVQSVARGALAIDVDIDIAPPATRSEYTDAVPGTLASTRSRSLPMR